MTGLWDLILTGVCSILFYICKWLLRFVELVELFFNVFAGTEKILYGDEKTYLINIFFGHDAVTNAFWAMAIIAMILSFGFTIIALARKVTDVSGTTKHTVGQIVSNFIRSMLAILLLNLCIVASINVTNVLLDQIDFALTNAEVLDVESGTRKVDEAEYAAMTRILATVANYNVNKGAEMRYNVNACFNAIRTDLQALQSRGFFEYEYAMTPSGHHTWQTALAYAANAADLSVDLNLNQYYPQVDEAISLLAKELATNPEFKPVEAGTKAVNVAPNVKVMLFLVSSFGAEHNSIYRNGSMEDALRRSYLNETKDCTDVDTVEQDFELTEINYILLLAGSYVFLMLMLTCIIQFIERLFNLVLFYITGPLFASSMSLDEGGKFQSWLQGFVLQLLGAFGTVLVMRIYLIIMPVMSSKSLVFFPSVDGFWGTTINYMAQLILIIGGAFAVSKANGIIGAALAGNSAMAAMGQLAEANSIAGGLTKAGAMKAAKLGASAAATGVKGAAKFAFDPLGQAKKGAGAVVGGVGAAFGAVKNAFGNNETIGAIAGAINRSRIRKMNKGITSEKSTNLNATGAKGSFEHSGGFGNRMKLEDVKTEKATKSKTDDDAGNKSQRKWSKDSPMAYFEGRTQMSSPYSDHRTKLAENERKEKAAKKQSSHEAPTSRRLSLSLDDDGKGSPPLGGGKGNENGNDKGTPPGVTTRNERETGPETKSVNPVGGTQQTGSIPTPPPMAGWKGENAPGVKGNTVPGVQGKTGTGAKGH